MNSNNGAIYTFGYEETSAIISLKDLRDGHLALAIRNAIIGTTGQKDQVVVRCPLI